MSVLFLLTSIASTADQRQASGPQGAAGPCISLVERSAYHFTSAEAAEVLTQADVLRRIAQRPDIPELEATCPAYYDKLFRELGSDRFRTHLVTQGFTAQDGRTTIW